MDQWEYRIATFLTSTSGGNWIARWMEDNAHKSEEGSLDTILDTFGGNGWELVRFGSPLGSNTAVFKRRKP